MHSLKLIGFREGGARTLTTRQSIIRSFVRSWTRPWVRPRNRWILMARLMTAQDRDSGATRLPQSCARKLSTKVCLCLVCALKREAFVYQVRAKQRLLTSLLKACRINSCPLSVFSKASKKQEVENFSRKRMLTLQKRCSTVKPKRISDRSS